VPRYVYRVFVSGELDDIPLKTDKEIAVGDDVPLGEHIMCVAERIEDDNSHSAPDSRRATENDPDRVIFKRLYCRLRVGG